MLFLSELKIFIDTEIGASNNYLFDLSLLKLQWYFLLLKSFACVLSQAKRTLGSFWNSLRGLKQKWSWEMNWFSLHPGKDQNFPDSILCKHRGNKEQSTSHFSHQCPLNQAQRSFLDRSPASQLLNVELSGQRSQLPKKDASTRRTVQLNWKLRLPPGSSQWTNKQRMRLLY